MEFKIECPWCNQHYTVDDSFIGQDVECSLCGKQFTVRRPNAATPPPSSTLPEAVASETTSFFRTTVATNSENKSADYFSNQHFNPTKEKMTKRNLPRVFVGLVVLVAFFVALCVILYSISIVKEKITESILRQGIEAFDEHRFEDAFNFLQYPASRGKSEAQFLLGMCYYNGDGVKKDLSEAVKMFRRAAEQNNLQAQFKMGVCYLDGTGVNAREDEALYWLQKSAEQGNNEAQLFLGDFYYEKGTILGFSEALKWYQKAEKTGKSDRKEQMDNCNLFIRAEEGNTEAQLGVFLAYTGGILGVKQNTDEAKKWLTRAAESGSAEAQCLLGALYRDKGDKNEAFKWFNKAAEQGNKEGQFALGGHYLVEKNYKEAIPWFRKAAEQGHVKSMYALGLCLVQHYGETSRIESMKWIQKAADQGDTDALELLEKLYR